MGEGLPPEPMRLAQCVWRWEFVDMAEMLPELWARRSDDNPNRCPTDRVRCPIADLRTWLKAFAIYVAVMSQKNRGRCTKADGLYGINNPGRRGLCGRCLGAL